MWKKKKQLCYGSRVTNKNDCFFPFGKGDLICIFACISTHYVLKMLKQHQLIAVKVYFHLESCCCFFFLNYIWLKGQIPAKNNFKITLKDLCILSYCELMPCRVYWLVSELLKCFRYEDNMWENHVRSWKWVINILIF